MALASLIRPRICELGKIKIGGLGEERVQGDKRWRLPQKLDHFVITTLQRDEQDRLLVDGPLMASLSDYADADGKLRQIPVALLSNDPEEVMQAAWVWYCGKKLGARSDGKTVTWYYDPNTGQAEKEPWTESWNPDYATWRDPKGNVMFKLHTTMNVVIAAKQARWGGVYKFRTTSQISASQLFGGLDHLRMMTGGVLRGLPLRLVVRPVLVTPDGRPNTVYVVHLELVGEDFAAIQESAMRRAQLEIANAKQLAQAQREYRALLSSPADFDDDVDEETTGAEFHPAAAAAEVPAVPSRQVLLRSLDDLCAATGQTALELIRDHASAIGYDPRLITDAEKLADESLAEILDAACRHLAQS